MSNANLFINIYLQHHPKKSYLLHKNKKSLHSNMHTIAMQLFVFVSSSSFFVAVVFYIYSTANAIIKNDAANASESGQPLFRYKIVNLLTH